MRRWRSAVFVSLSLAWVAVACSLQDGGIAPGFGTDGSATNDGTFDDGATSDGATTGDSPSGDSSSPDGGGDASTGSVYCLSTLTNVGSCVVECAGLPFECPGTIPACVNACGSCPGTGFLCNACFSDGGPARAVCEPEDAAAFSECLAGYSRCSCSDGDAGDCPGSTQTCNGGACFECGEVDAGNNGAACNNRKSCKEDTGHYGECNP